MKSREGGALLAGHSMNAAGWPELTSLRWLLLPPPASTPLAAGGAGAEAVGLASWAGVEEDPPLPASGALTREEDLTPPLPDGAPQQQQLELFVGQFSSSSSRSSSSSSSSSSSQQGLRGDVAC